MKDFLLGFFIIYFHIIMLGSFLINAENENFDQHLGCAAPKRWLKYTTGDKLSGEKCVDKKSTS